LDKAMPGVSQVLSEDKNFYISTDVVLWT